MRWAALLSPELRERLRARVEPLARALSRAGLSADALTVIGFLVACAGALLAALGAWLPAGIVATLGAAFDMLDGAVARLTGSASRLGAFLDSVFDRWGEGVVYLGIIIGSTTAGFEMGAWLSAAALVSAYMVSYARARAESLGFAPGKGMAAVGLAPREVRVVILGIGLVGGGLLGGVGTTGTSGGESLLGGSLAVIAVLATITVVQRVLFVRTQAQHQSEVEPTS